MIPYSMETIKVMQTFYNTLSEKDKRRDTATEAVKLGHDGVSYIADTPDYTRSTIHTGIGKLKSMLSDTVHQEHIRRPGAGRTRYNQTINSLNAAFLAVFENHTAGNPMQPSLRWTNLTHTDIVKRLSDDLGICVSKIVVPNGIYDLGLNQEFINLGTSRDTSEFATDSLCTGWNTQGQYNYPSAT